MVLLQAAISNRGPAFACQQLVDAGKVNLFVSPEVLAEITDVLNRPKLQTRFKTLTPEMVDSFLRELTSKAIVLKDVPLLFSIERDPDDDCYVNLALAAGAAFLVTWDNDLLGLMSENTEGTDFRRRFPGLAILTPVDFLREFVKASPAAPGA